MHIHSAFRVDFCQLAQQRHKIPGLFTEQSTSHGSAWGRGKGELPCFPLHLHSTCLHKSFYLVYNCHFPGFLSSFSQAARICAFCHHRGSHLEFTVADTQRASGLLPETWITVPCCPALWLASSEWQFFLSDRSSVSLTQRPDWIFCSLSSCSRFLSPERLGAGSIFP